jgi:predicted transposase/invertase (TIGR01784 family)
VAALFNAIAVRRRQSRQSTGAIIVELKLGKTIIRENSHYAKSHYFLKTDSIFFKIFQTDPGILFELLGQSPDLAQGYEFRSVEIKQVAFRLDGVLLPKPDSSDQTVWFIEVQFQEVSAFYNRFFGEIFLFLQLHPQTVDYKAVVIYPNRSVEPQNQYLYRANLNSDQVHRIYLDELKGLSTDSLGLGMMQLILAKSGDAVAQARSLLAKTQAQDRTDSKIAAIMELIETIVFYKFPLLSREEIERMLGLSELRETKVYQEALQEGEQVGVLKGKLEGKLEGEQLLILRQLTRRIGKVTPKMRTRIQDLSLVKLEALGEALLDFSEARDLEQWLADN